MRSDGTLPGGPEPFGSQVVTQPPIESWSPSPYNWAGVRGNVAAEVEGHPERYPVLRLWEAHLAEPENYPHPGVPFTENENNHRCDLSSPALQKPGGSYDPPPMTEKLPTPFPTPDRPVGAEGAPDPYLRWGTTRWGGDYLDNWLEWGWRHIHAKHGWSPDDELATRSTLQAPVLTLDTGSVAMRYIGPEYERGGAWCQRVVDVDYRVEAVSGKPYGIMTSFAQYKREAP